MFVSVTTLQSQPTYVPWERRDAGQKYIRRLYEWASTRGPSYLTPEEEEELHIKVDPLDLKSGNNTFDGGPRFTEPAARDKMNEFIDHYRPWEEYDLLAVRDDELPAYTEKMIWVERHRGRTAGYLLGTLCHFATRLDESAPFFFNGAWDDFKRLDLHRPYRLRSTDPNGNEWSLYGSLLPRDKSKPHIFASVTEGARMDENATTRGEVAIASGIISLQRCYFGYGSYRYVPVTMLSASDRQVRVVQAWHDRMEPEVLHMRRSPILEFWDGAMANREDWITLLCWLMADPVGDLKD